MKVLNGSQKSTQLRDSENHKAKKKKKRERERKKLGIKGTLMWQNKWQTLFFLLICKQDRRDLWTRGQWRPRLLSQRRYLRSYLERSDEGQTNSRCREDN